MTKKDIYKPIFTKIGEPPVNIPEGKRYPLELDEIPFKEIIDLLENLINLVGQDYEEGAYFEIEGRGIEPIITKAKKILEILK